MWLGGSDRILVAVHRLNHAWHNFHERKSVFYTGETWEKQKKFFKLIKFRTRDNRKDKNGNLLPDEVRLNKYGRFLRGTSLDELPEGV